MSVRPPQSLGRPAFSGVNVLEYELMAERADALGRHGLKVEKALERLRADDVGNDPQRRNDMLDAAADAVWAFFIQREICGLRDQRDVVRRYDIPKEVLARVGIVRKAP
ncbi:DUF6665 family protein [Mycoplana dimorpha]|uniref:MazG-like nucleotide pyrophosphohydrolase family protein n=1 Tax=Mycoplana dimorpha TaxID=28320 RepID=A0A2T5BEI7_MYCDI|nr:DUF6665 family protein [Mycoplana dimorpha]PTM97414.1 hypothetical protein C7449_102286 [Mycoplana dimorpha]